MPGPYGCPCYSPTFAERPFLCSKHVSPMGKHNSISFFHSSSGHDLHSYRFTSTTTYSPIVSSYRATSSCVFSYRGELGVSNSFPFLLQSTSTIQPNSNQLSVVYASTSSSSTWTTGELDVNSWNLIREELSSYVSYQYSATIISNKASNPIFETIRAIRQSEFSSWDFQSE